MRAEPMRQFFSARVMFKLATAILFALAMVWQTQVMAQSTDGPRYVLPPVGSYSDSEFRTNNRTMSVKSGASLQKALNAAPPNTTIFVAPGQYAGDLVITEPVDLVVQSQPTASQVGSSCDSVGSNCARVTVDDNNVCVTIRLKQSQGRVRLSGFSWGPKGSYRSQPCIVLDQGYLILENSRIETTRHYPAVVLRGGESRIQNNDIVGGLVGVQVDVASQSGLGVVASEGGGHYLVNNRIYNNETGLRINYSTKTYAFLNQIYDNRGFGIAIYDGGGFYAANQVGGNAAGGLFIGPNDKMPTFVSNTISFNDQAAIVMNSGESSRFQSNLICGNDSLIFSSRPDLVENQVLDPASGNIVFSNGSKSSKGLFGRSRSDQCPGG